MHTYTRTDQVYKKPFVKPTNKSFGRAAFVSQIDIKLSDNPNDVMVSLQRKSNLTSRTFGTGHFEES